MADISIAGEGLAVKLGTGPDGKVKSRFALLSKDWVSLQASTAVALDLPVSHGNFEEKYGSFGTSAVITDCISAMRDVQNTAQEFGDPARLRKQLIQDKTLLNTQAPPKEIYTHGLVGPKGHDQCKKADQWI
ncbi:MAG: hypothetical protein KC448_13625 [Yoonia sp.]|nr:hypothetical protein [Yoonia sp.]